MNELTTIIKGNVTSDPDKRNVNGKTVVSFGAVHKVRRWDRETNGFVNAETILMNCSVWGPQGDHAYESLRKGDRIIAEVNLTQREINGKPVMEATVVEIGASLLFHEVDIDADNPNGGGSTTPPRADGPGF